MIGQGRQAHTHTQINDRLVGFVFELRLAASNWTNNDRWQKHRFVYVYFKFSLQWCLLNTGWANGQLILAKKGITHVIITRDLFPNIEFYFNLLISKCDQIIGQLIVLIFVQFLHFFPFLL